MKQARIYSPIQSPMQSGKSLKQKWIIEFLPENSLSINPVIGCTSSSDTQNQIHLTFDSQASAILYAEENKIQYELIELAVETIKIKSYTDNYKP